MKLKDLLEGRDKLRKYDELKAIIDLITESQKRWGENCDMAIGLSPYVQQIVLAALDAEIKKMEEE